MLAGIANYLFQITLNKMGLTPIYKTINRFMLHSNIVKRIKNHEYLSFVAKQRFIKHQRKFFLMTNFFTTRLYYNFKEYGLKYVVKKRVKRMMLPQLVRSSLFCWKTIKYFQRIGEKVDGYAAILPNIYHHLEKRADYVIAWILGRYKNETERLKLYREGRWIYQYADILKALVEERGTMKILMTDKYDDEED